MSESQLSSGEHSRKDYWRKITRHVHGIFSLPAWRRADTQNQEKDPQRCQSSDDRWMARVHESQDDHDKQSGRDKFREELPGLGEKELRIRAEDDGGLVRSDIKSFKAVYGAAIIGIKQSSPGEAAKHLRPFRQH